MKTKLIEVQAAMRALHQRAETENRDFTAEETEQWDRMKAEAESLTNRLARVASLPAAPVLRTDPNIGLSPEEIKEYSLVRAINAAANHSWRGAELEREASDAVAAKLGREPRSFFVPADFLERRDMLVGTTTAGGFLKGTDLQGQNFIDMLMNKMVLKTAGATVLSGLVGDVAIPKQTGGATAYWVTENVAPTEGNQTVGQVLLQPKTVGAFSDISRKLLIQSSIDVENMVRRDLANSLALAIDLAGFHGTGADDQPAGLAVTAGIGSVVGGTNGVAPTWANIVALETEVAVDNADIGALAYITNAKVRGKLKTTLKTATYGDAPVWENGVGPLNGYPGLVTNQVSSALTKGTSSGVCSAIFFGNWGDLLIGLWGSLDMLVDPYTGGTAGTVRVIAFQSCDVAVRRAESFAAMLDVLTA